MRKDKGVTAPEHRSALPLPPSVSLQLCPLEAEYPRNTPSQALHHAVRELRLFSSPSLWDPSFTILHTPLLFSIPAVLPLSSPPWVTCHVPCGNLCSHGTLTSVSRASFSSQAQTSFGDLTDHVSATLILPGPPQIVLILSCTSLQPPAPMATPKLFPLRPPDPRSPTFPPSAPDLLLPSCWMMTSHPGLASASALRTLCLFQLPGQCHGYP